MKKEKIKRMTKRIKEKKRKTITKKRKKNYSFLDDKDLVDLVEELEGMTSSFDIKDDEFFFSSITTISSIISSSSSSSV